MIPGPCSGTKLKEKKIPNTDKQLAELLVEEKELLEQKKKEQGALKQKLRASQETAPGGRAQSRMNAVRNWWVAA